MLETKSEAAIYLQLGKKCWIIFTAVNRMNGSPLTKDQKTAKVVEVKKPRQLISSGTARKILKTSGAVIGTVETAWLNRYMENKVSGECLPRSFVSNDLYAEICRTYGKGSTQFIEKIVNDFKRENGIEASAMEDESSEED